MNKIFSGILGQFNEFYKSLGPTKRLALVASLFIGFVAICSVMFMASGKDYATLLTNIPSDQVAVLIEKLNSKNIPYQLVDEGKTIPVTQPTVLMDQGGSVMNVMTDGTVGTLRRETHGHEPSVVYNMAVRRLTPVECERLQGFPDGYTDIKPRGKDTPDGPRYKALGNSMAVPVMAWIGKRINQYELKTKLS